MEVEGGKSENAANVQQWGADDPVSHNTWRVLSAGEGYYYIYSQVGDKITYLLDVANGSATMEQIFRFTAIPRRTHSNLSL